MEEWVIGESPALLCLFGAALFFCLFDKKYRSTKGVFTWISGVLCVTGAAVALLDGASLQECSAVLLIFLLLNMGVRA